MLFTMTARPSCTPSTGAQKKTSELKCEGYLRMIYGNGAVPGKLSQRLTR